MIQIKPSIDFSSSCLYCKKPLLPRDILWQGVHVCVESECSGCGSKIIEDLAIGQAVFTPFQVDLDKRRIFSEFDYLSIWDANPFSQSLGEPKYDHEIKLGIEKFREFKEIVILNCIDHLYGHTLLKLLNAETYLMKGLGLVVIVPPFLRWMVPEGVAEIWTVNIPMSKALNYYPEFDRLVKKECERFDSIYISRANSHPREFDITNFTGIQKHDYNSSDYRVSFIWREDRPWFSGIFSFKLIKKFDLKWLLKILTYWQSCKVKKLFKKLKKNLPDARFTVCGVGKTTRFPEWIEDMRVTEFSEEIEKMLCQCYSESRLIIGVHGSNMLLPSAHAGMVVDLMPEDRWRNFAQDILYQNNDSFHRDMRLLSWKYRYMPVNTSISKLSSCMQAMVSLFDLAVFTFDTSIED